MTNSSTEMVRMSWPEVLAFAKKQGKIADHVFERFNGHYCTNRDDVVADALALFFEKWTEGYFWNCPIKADGSIDLPDEGSLRWLKVAIFRQMERNIPALWRRWNLAPLPSDYDKASSAPEFDVRTVALDVLANMRDSTFEALYGPNRASAQMGMRKTRAIRHELPALIAEMSDGYVSESYVANAFQNREKEVLELLTNAA